MSDDLLVERAGAVATLVLNRQDSHNAIRLGMYEELPGLLAEIDADPAVKVSGKSLNAELALRVGLVDEVVPAEELERHTYDFAELLTTRAQYSVRAAKEIVGRIAGGQTEDDEATTRLRNTSFDTEDYAEGVRAFLAKRPPVFT